jgi:ribonuclease D
VYILRIFDTGITNAIHRFLSNAGIEKIGIGISDDLSALQKRRKFKPAGFRDLNKLAEDAGFENIGARNLAGMVLGVRISKSQQRSNWENPQLTEQQIAYAATDAWICLEIYELLKAEGIIS